MNMTSHDMSQMIKNKMKMTEMLTKSKKKFLLVLS